MHRRQFLKSKTFLLLRNATIYYNYCYTTINNISQVEQKTNLSVSTQTKINSSDYLLSVFVNWRKTQLSETICRNDSFIIRLRQLFVSYYTSNSKLMLLTKHLFDPTSSFSVDSPRIGLIKSIAHISIASNPHISEVSSHYRIYVLQNCLHWLNSDRKKI